jgi:hypothetical protein
MPINYKLYPPDWSEIRKRILERANDSCEMCGLNNKSKIHSFKENKVTIWRDLSYAEWLDRGSPKHITVVLTIAHLDHDETNHEVKDDRLMALCQLCHLRYDIEEKNKRRISKWKK